MLMPLSLAVLTNATVLTPVPMLIWPFGGTTDVCVNHGCVRSVTVHVVSVGIPVIWCWPPDPI
jgi:RNase P/RNase MRP subunit p30